MTINIVTVYKPPNEGDYSLPSLKKMLKTLGNRESLILGDFNNDWGNKTKRKKLKTIFDKQGYTHLVATPTRLTATSATIIDLLITNKPERIFHNFII